MAFVRLSMYMHAHTHTRIRSHNRTCMLKRVRVGNRADTYDSWLLSVLPAGRGLAAENAGKCLQESGERPPAVGSM